MGSDVNSCLNLRPSRAEFDRPFTDYVQKVLDKHGVDLPCFKVIPPKGWSPRRSQRQPDTDKIRIDTPIKQHVFGKQGAWQCILEEQRGMSVADLKKMASAHQPPSKGQQGDELHERAFWSSLTSRPPIYGADMPVSLFDKKLDSGWNLRNLGCMLCSGKFDVPDIPGVTSPMTYWGTWKSFFGWHSEDVDLLSTNYLHFGASKVWYCVSPKDKRKFDEMARALFPEAFAACPAFMRHKDIMISPKVLRSWGVPFVQAKQDAGEFMVLNAAAYHAGYNLGFNCAEAVNFAMPSWLEAGKAAVSCCCSALPDGVALDMGIFLPEEEEEESDEEDGSSSSSSEDEGGEQDSGAPPSSSGRQLQQRRARQRQRGVALARQQQQQQPRGSGKRLRPAAGLGPRHGSRAGSVEAGDLEGTPSSQKRRRLSSGAAKPHTPHVPEVARRSARGGETPRGAAHCQWGGVAEDKPMALVERDERTRQIHFSLVHRLAKRAARAGAVWLGLLTADEAGLYRPTANMKCMQLGVSYPRLVHVRTEWVASSGGKRKGGWKLTTKPERILM